MFFDYLVSVSDFYGYVFRHTSSKITWFINAPNKMTIIDAEVAPKLCRILLTTIIVSTLKYHIANHSFRLGNVALLPEGTILQLVNNIRYTRSQTGQGTPDAGGLAGFLRELILSGDDHLVLSNNIGLHANNLHNLFKLIALIRPFQ